MVKYQLPFGWYELKSPKGRLYYMDSINKILTWLNPSIKYDINISWERVDSQS